MFETNFVAAFLLGVKTPKPGPTVEIFQCVYCSLFTAWLLMLYFYHLLFTKRHVFLILHKAANVPGPENLTSYDEKDVNFSALKPS